MTTDEVAEALKDVISFGAENGSSLAFVHYEVSTTDPTTIHVTVNKDMFCHGNKEGERFTIKITPDNRHVMPYRWAIKAVCRFDGKVRYIDTGTYDMAVAIEIRDETKKIMPAGHSVDEVVDPYYNEVTLVKAKTPWNCEEQPIPDIWTD